MLVGRGGGVAGAPGWRYRDRRRRAEPGLRTGFFSLFLGIYAGWEATRGIGNRKLCIFPKTPRLPRSVWQNLPTARAIPREIAHRIVIPAMNPSRGPRSQACVAAALAAPVVFVRSRHGTCLALSRVKNNSLPAHGSVNFSPSAAKSDAWRHGRPAGTNDSLGLLPQETNSTHGHSGRFVVPAAHPWWCASSPVVFRPVCEAVLQQRPLSFGPGLLAALTPRSPAAERISAHANRSSRATRPPGPTMTRAASFPCMPVGLSDSRERRTPPKPTRASATGHEST
jgi:hypothetical protein